MVGGEGGARTRRAWVGVSMEAREGWDPLLDQTLGRRRRGCGSYAAAREPPRLDSGPQLVALGLSGSWLRISGFGV